MGTMSGAEGVIDVHVDAAHEASHEIPGISLLAGVEPEVLEKLDFWGQFTKTGGDRLHGVPGIGCTFRTPEMTGAHHLCSPLGEPLNGGQGGPNTKIVGDPTGTVGERLEVGRPSIIDQERLIRAPAWRVRSTSRLL